MRNKTTENTWCRGLARLGKRRYAPPVPIGRQPANRVHRLPFPRELEGHEGEWVAVRHGTVVLSAMSSSELAAKIKASRLPVAGMTIEYVRPASCSYIVGVG
jgi:hypothetical protein